MSARSSLFPHTFLLTARYSWRTLADTNITPAARTLVRTRTPGDRDGRQAKAETERGYRQGAGRAGSREQGPLLRRRPVLWDHCAARLWCQGHGEGRPVLRLELQAQGPRVP